MPWRRSRSATGTPASPSFKIATICSSVNRDFRMLPPGTARGVYHAVVSEQGKLTHSGKTLAGLGRETRDPALCGRASGPTSAKGSVHYEQFFYEGSSRLRRL